jgi:acyl carrier protein
VDNVADRIRRFIQEEILLGETIDIRDDTPLLEGVLDSLALTQLVGFIEEEFDAEVGDADITSENFRTIADVERLVRSRVGAA